MTTISQKDPVAEALKNMIPPDQSGIVYVAKRYIVEALASGNANAFAFAVQNPEGVDCIVTNVIVDITTAGGKAVGLSGKDGGMIRARKLRRSVPDPDSNIERILDLGFVGEPHEIDAEVVIDLLESDIIPVIAPIGLGDNGETYNINADTVAGAIAGAVDAVRLFLLTDVIGVLDKSGELIPEMSAADAERLIKDGTIEGGMIPKVETCVRAVQDDVEAAVILDGRVPHTLLLETFTERGIGTLIR